MTKMWKGEAVVPSPAGEGRDPRPVSVKSQDAALWEYAVRNRLLRGAVQAPEASSAGQMPRPPRRGSAWAAAKAEGIYRRIAPPDQKYPLRAVALVRRLLAEGAPDEYVLGKYRTHVRYCSDIGVAPVPLIPYLTELLETFRLDANALCPFSQVHS